MRWEAVLGAEWEVLPVAKLIVLPVAGSDESAAQQSAIKLTLSGSCSEMELGGIQRCSEKLL